MLTDCRECTSRKIGVCIPREIHFFYDQLWSEVMEEAERASQAGVEFINRPVPNLGRGDAKAFLTVEDHLRKAEGFSEAFPRHCAEGQIGVIECQEDEEESFLNTLDLLRGNPDLAGIYVNTVKLNASGWSFVPSSSA